MALELFGTPMSPFVRKVRICLEEKGLDYTLHPVSPFDPPAGWRELSPLGRVPVLRDTRIGTDGAAGTLADSSSICVYLERLAAQPRLYPADPFEHARAIWLEEFADTELAVRIGFGIWRTVVMGPLNGQEPDCAAAEATVRDKLPRSFAYLEAQLGSRSGFSGDMFSIADIAVVAQLIGFRHGGFVIDAVAYPALAAWLERTLARSSVARLLEEDFAALGAHSRMIRSE